MVGEKSVAEFCLPPASNWFLSKCLSSSQDGRIAYASKTSIVILKTRPRTDNSDEGSTCKISKRLTFFIPSGASDKQSSEQDWRSRPAPHDPPKVDLTIWDAHDFDKNKGKVTSVSFCPTESPLPNVDLASSGEEGAIRLWNTKTGSLVIEHKLHQELTPSKDRHRVQCISWSKADPSLIYSADENGNVVAWNIQTNTTRSSNFGNNNITVIQSHPRESDILAFGCKFGLVFIVNVLGSGRVLQKLRGHDEDTHFLSWCPVAKNVLQEVQDGEEQTEDSLLVSSSRDRTLCIWSMRIGRMQAKLQLPFLFGAKKGDNKPHFWNTCLWVKPTTILSSGLSGELLEWDLTKLRPNPKGGAIRSDGMAETSVIHKEHNRTLYSVEAIGGSVQTIGQDRNIVSVDLASHQLDFNIPTLNGAVFAMASNPIDRSVVAIGAGDNNIRIWRTKSSKAPLDVDCIWQKLNNAKITALAWHPSKEGLLAFGTDEGRIGLLDALQSRPSPTIFRYQHRSTVYNLNWGPAVGKALSDVDLSKYVLYSLGDGVIMMHDPKSEEEPDNIEKTIEAVNNFERKAPSRSEMAFQPTDFNYVLLGSDDGSIEMLAMPNLKLVCRIKSFQKLIQSIAWHPKFCGDSSETSKLADCVAVASNEHSIHLWNLGDIIKQYDPVTTEAAIVLTQPTRVLSGHLQRVIQVTWSPHQEERLLSVSYDNTAQIWDASTGTPIANFSGHDSRLFCGIWDHNEENLVLTGGEDYTVQVWHVDKQPGKVPVKKPNKTKHRKPQYRPTPTASAAVEPTSPTKRPADEPSAQSERPLTAPGRKRLSKQLFQRTKAAENEKKSCAPEDILLLDQCFNEKTKDLEDVEELHLAFFGDRDAMFDLLEKESTSLLETGCTETAAHMHLWSGDTKTIVRRAIDKAQLTDWVVNLANAVSSTLWTEACCAYANQLAAKDDFIKANSYLLMVGQVEKAIQMLQKAKEFRVALAIAKSRLPISSPILPELYRSWALSLTEDGNLEQASRCWIAAGDRLSAAKSLQRRSGGLKGGSPSWLFAAAILTKRAGETDSAHLLAVQCLDKSEDNDEYFHKILEEFPELQWRKLQREVESILKTREELKDRTDEPTGKFPDLTDEGILFDGLPLMEFLRKEVVRELTSEEQGRFYAEYSKIPCMKSAEIKTKKQLLCAVSSELTRAVLIAQENQQTCLEHTVQTLSLCLETENFKKLQLLVRSLFPKGTDPPEVGNALWQQPLDWQCQWVQLRSLQSIAAVAKFKTLKLKLKGLKELEFQEELKEKFADDLFNEIVDICDNFQFDDVITSQKLLAEIAAAEKAIPAFVAAEESDGEQPAAEPVDLPPQMSLDQSGAGDLSDCPRGTQTLQLGDDGEWKSVPTDPNLAPPDDPNMPAMPPPMGLQKSFAERFLKGRVSDEEAKKELQRLKWVHSRTNTLVTPYPNLTLLAKEVVEWIAFLEECGFKFRDKRDLVARWAYWKGETAWQGFFLEHC